MYYVIYGALHNISTQIIALHKDAGRELILETSSDTDSQSWARQASKPINVLRKKPGRSCMRVVRFLGVRSFAAQA